jgi:hypothetical protein
MPTHESSKGFTGQKVQEMGTYATEGGAVQTYMVGDRFGTHPQSGKRVVWEKTSSDKKLGDAH